MKLGRGRLILISAYLVFIVAVVYSANSQQWLAPLFSWLHRTPGGDKICHFLLAGGFAVAVNWLLHCHSLGSLQLGTVICLIFATLEECSQIWIPSRSFDLGDMAMNTLGILLFGPLARRLPSTSIKRADSPDRPLN